MKRILREYSFPQINQSINQSKKSVYHLPTRSLVFRRSIDYCNALSFFPRRSCATRAASIEWTEGWSTRTGGRQTDSSMERDLSFRPDTRMRHTCANKSFQPLSAVVLIGKSGCYPLQLWRSQGRGKFLNLVNLALFCKPMAEFTKYHKIIITLWQK